GKSGGSGQGAGKGSGGAQGGKGGAPGSQLSTPLAGNGLHGTFGGYRTYPVSRSQSFYSLGYGSTSLLTHGNVYSGTKVADYDPIDFGGGPVDLELGSGKSQIGGTVVHSLNTIPLNAFKIPIPAFRINDPSLRILIGFDGQTEKSPQQHLLFGVEYRPHLNTAGAPVAKGAASAAPKAGSDQERFIGIGIATEKHVDNGSGISETDPAIVFHGRVGIGFDFVTSKSRIEAAKQAAQTALGQVAQEQDKLQKQKAAPKARGAVEVAEDADNFDITRDNARNLTARFGMNPASAEARPRGPVPEGLDLERGASLADLSNELDRMPQARGPSDANSTLAIAASKLVLLDRLAGLYKSFLSLKEKEAAGSLFKNAPRLSLYTEFDGSYGLKNHTSYARYRSIWSANVKFDLDPANAGLGFILLRYENGFCRAEPNRRADALTLTFGFSFP
ncbi:MAG: hypothetical protein ACHQ50_04480, partial [Fimbriimonadales bacterium]